MSIKLSDSIRVGQQKPLEDKYFNELVPYTSTSQVNTLLPKADRHIGLTVNINREEYWYKDGIENENLVLKIINNSAYDLKNQEQDDRLTALEGEDVSQNDIINDLFSEIEAERTRNDIQDSALNNLEGINYVWSPTNRTLTLYDSNGNQLSQVSLVSLDNEGTDLRYNASTLSLELYNADNELLDSIPVSSFVGSVGTQLQLNSNELQLKDSQGTILATVTFEVNNINGLQTILNNKQDKLQNVTGNIGVGKTDASATEKLDVNGNVKANGFKTPNGTNIQYLMSDGSTSTLPTDLIKGTGTINYLTKITSSGTIGNSQILDDGTNVGIGTTIPTSKLSVYSAGASIPRIGRFVQNNIGTSSIGALQVVNAASTGSAFDAGHWTSSSSDWIIRAYNNVSRAENADVSGASSSLVFGVRADGNVCIGTTSPSEKLDVNGNVKANGFKTPTGTATQGLRADGSVFDLTTKADLDGGKVPKAQSQPSTMVMNSSTYVITFTDATGAVQTIDLPLESLFKDANYNSSTKSLIVTLQDGTTRTIPLTDLVDLPEIVLATSIPAVTSTTGQKVYFDTSLGKVWFNVNGAWTYAGNLISDSEKTNITTAYNHSQTPGNAHNTKVEELSDVGNETTTIADTDVILKKEVVGGLWRKITFANFKNWFTTELAKKINIGTDTFFNFKNISAMTLPQFRALTPNLETIYFTEEQNSTGWQQVRYNSNLSIGYQALTESVITINNENFLELDSDSTFNLIDVATTKINGIFEKDFMIITFSAKVDTPSTPNQWFKFILRVNGVQVAVSPVFYLLESAGMPERISHSFALNVTPEIVTHGATLHIKPSVMLILNSHALTVTRVHKSSNANL